MNSVHQLKGDKSPIITGSSISQLNVSTQSAIDTLWRKVADINFQLSQTNNDIKKLKEDISEKVKTRKLIVGGETIFYGALSVSGSIASERHITASEYIRSFGELYSVGNTYLSSGLYVSGQSNLYDDLTVSGDVRISGNANVNNELNVSGVTNLYNTLNSNGSVNITGNSSVSGTTNNYGTVYNRSESYFGNVSGGNYSKIESNGTIVSYGDATVWEDLNFDPVRSGGPVANRPDDVTIDGCYYKEFTSANNQSCGDSQEIPHKTRLSSTLYPHLHCFLKSGEASGTTGVLFNVNWHIRTSGSFTSGVSSLSATSAQLVANPYLFTVSDNTGFSCPSGLGGQLTLGLYRVSGDAGDVIVTTYGIHYESDKNGSNTITTK